eukprot:3454635-Prymnesium_polylepis.3
MRTRAGLWRRTQGQRARWVPADLRSTTAPAATAPPPGRSSSRTPQVRRPCKVLRTRFSGWSPATYDKI